MNFMSSRDSSKRSYKKDNKILHSYIKESKSHYFSEDTKKLSMVCVFVVFVHCNTLLYSYACHVVINIIRSIFMELRTGIV